LYKPDTTCVPLGEKATELTKPEWPSSVCSAVSVAAFPELHCLIARARHDLLAVGREGH
jgi:hypothetical protein